MALAASKRALRPPAILNLSIQYGVAKRGLPSPQRIRSWARAALLADMRVTFRLVGAREGRMLNRDFRGQDHATNVLTFAYPEMEPLAGDIVLCVPLIAREARQQHKRIDAHFAHLIVHGMLHLQGYDHESDKDARIMEALEAEIVVKLGYADPYEFR